MVSDQGTEAALRHTLITSAHLEVFTNILLYITATMPLIQTDTIMFYTIKWTLE